MHILLASAISIITIISCSNESKSTGNSRELVADPEGAKKDSFMLAKPDTIQKYFPFELNDIEGHHQIAAQIEGPGLYPKYYDFFKKYGYEGNGVCWQGHIIQILEKLDKELLKHIDFDPEAGGFFATADTKANQLKFVELLSPIFSDLEKLKIWVSTADRSRIDD